jgi:predicted RNase H-like nuclease (RuvC/YqgF family)
MDSTNGKKGIARNHTEAGSVLNLQKQLADQDRKIEELTSQLEALKRIDQEMRDKVRPIRPPSTVAPPQTVPEPTTP